MSPHCFAEPDHLTSAEQVLHFQVAQNARASNMSEPKQASNLWRVWLPPLLLFFATMFVVLKVMPSTGENPQQVQSGPAPASALPPMPEMTVAAYKVHIPEGGVWLPGVLGRLDGTASGDYKVFVKDAKGFGGIVARVSPDTEEGRQVYEILKGGDWRLITFAVRPDPKRAKKSWEIVEPLPVIRIVGVKK
jgi:hypothetical protein